MEEALPSAAGKHPRVQLQSKRDISWIWKVAHARADGRGKGEVDEAEDEGGDEEIGECESHFCWKQIYHLPYMSALCVEWANAHARAETGAIALCLAGVRLGPALRLPFTIQAPAVDNSNTRA